ncbi:MAG: phosphatidylglycerophosphatase A [Rickettsiales endosymbiont of Dermacentor nuttalli]
MNYNTISFWHPASLISTFFGLGKIPIMPGTFGSIAAYFILSLKIIIVYFLGTRVSSINTVFFIFAIGWLILLIPGTYAAHFYAKRTNKSDPKEIVIDEVIGQLLTLYITLPFSIQALPSDHDTSYMSISYVISVILIGPFILFRLFDIIKPWPIKWCDQNIKGGIGIVLDDIIAALMAGIIFNCIIIILMDKKII